MKRVFVITLFVFLIGIPASSHAEKEWRFVERDWKTTKIKRMVSDLYARERAGEAENYLISCGPKALEFVTPLLDDEGNESVRVSALYIIRKAGDSSYEEAVAGKLQDESPRVRKEAYKTLRVIGTKEYTEPESFHAEDEWEFINRGWKTNKIKRLVLKLYDKKQADSAKKYLSSYGPEVVEFVAPLVNDKNNENVRIDALYIIGQVGDSSYEELVIEKLRDRNRRVRQEAARTLTLIGTEKSIEPLKELLEDYNPDLRFNAIRALARIAPEQEKDLFIEALNNYDPRIRMFAVNALGKMKAADTVVYLSQMVQDEDTGVRFEVAKALGKIGTKECLKPLVWLTRDPEVSIRVLALRNVAKMDTPEAEKPLVKAAGSFDPRVASRAILSLGRLKSPKALDVARKYLDDEHILVRLACVEVLGMMGGEEERSLLEPLLEAESTKVRKRAKKALAEVDGRT